MDWIQQWQSKLNKQNGVAPLVRTGGSRHTGLAALPYRNIQPARQNVCSTTFDASVHHSRNHLRLHEHSRKDTKSELS